MKVHQAKIGERVRFTITDGYIDVIQTGEAIEIRSYPNGLAVHPMVSNEILVEQTSGPEG